MFGENNGCGAETKESREIRSRGQIEAVERASQRVGSWPQWKRSAISYRTASANAFFKRLFTLRSKYEVVEGAEAALKAESLPKRLTEKVLNLWGRCIRVKAKKPSLKVVIADPAKPAKKQRGAKGARP